MRFTPTCEGDRSAMKAGLVLGAGGVLGGAWLTGALHALARETEWDPGTADYVVGTSAGAMIGSLLSAGVPPWFMVAHSRGESFEGLTGPDGRPAAEADRAAGAVFRLHRGLPGIGPGSLRMAFTALSNPLRHTPLQLLAGWLPAGLISTEPLKDVVGRAVDGRWVGHPNFWAVACDYGSGRRVPFGREDAPHARVADAVARGLRREGMAVDVAYDGATALDKARLNPYDVVVLDRDLPELHGDEVCRALRDEEPQSRVLMLTAAARTDDLVDGLSRWAGWLPDPLRGSRRSSRWRSPSVRWPS